MADDPISPVAPIGAEPVEAPRSADPVTPASSVRATSAPAAAGSVGAPLGTPELGDAVAIDEVEHPVLAPADVEARATVHDAALHGGRMARAIEQAAAGAPGQAAAPGTRPDVNDRAQQLGGSMAAASSGQASPRADAPDVDDPQLDHVDPLAPISRIEAESHRRDDRHRAEEQGDADVHP
ncbi:MAG: hypothetical protein JWM98_142 [Thermoleophilia bacterium]|nr:hypothetical protein [Thermoleophilia bacterium]